MRAATAVQIWCKQVLAKEGKSSRRNLGRLDGIRAEAAASYRDQRVLRGATAIWRRVVRHAGAKDGNDQKHEPDEGCTARCVSGALRDYRGAGGDPRGGSGPR